MSSKDLITKLVACHQERVDLIKKLSNALETSLQGLEKVSILLPDTFGISDVQGAAEAGTGAMTLNAGEREYCEKVVSILKSDSQLLIGIKKQTLDIKDILKELCAGTTAQKMERIQDLHAVALIFGDTRMGRYLLAGYYSVAQPEISSKALVNYDSGKGNIFQKLVFGYIKKLERFEKWQIEKKRGMEKKPEEAEEDAERVEEDVEEIAAVLEGGALEGGALAVEVFLPAATIIEGVLALDSSLVKIPQKAIKQLQKVIEELIECTKKAGKAGNILSQLIEEIVENETEEDGKYLVSMFSASTFNIKGTTQNNDYKEFLHNVFEKLNCDLHHLQECIWGENSRVWNYILPGYKVNESTLDAGMAYKSELQVMSYSLEELSSPFPLRISCRMFSRRSTLEVDIKNSIPALGTTSDDILQFLSFSFHGYHNKVSGEDKMQQILTFFNYVQICCEKEELPAVVGGDFNFNIRNITELRKNNQITMHGERIDFLCTVCGKKFGTKMYVPPVIYFLKISDMAQTENIRGQITNHEPYYGQVFLYKKCSF